MENPYKKTDRSEYRAEYFTRGCTDRWAFFEASHGKLWSSAYRRKFQIDYARTYCESVCERWVRIYKRFLPVTSQANFLEKVKERDGWFSKALIRTVWQPNFNVVVSAPATLVSFFLEKGGALEKMRCPLCGSLSVASVGDAIIGEIPYRSNRYSYYGDGHCRDNGAFTVHCTNKYCEEVRNYWKKKGSVVENARASGVFLKRPKVDDLTNKEEAFVLMTAAMVDTEARTMAKQTKIEIQQNETV
jgi:hypothetical protein